MDERDRDETAVPANKMEVAVDRSKPEADGPIAAPAKDVEIKASPYRWLILFLMCAISAFSAFIWLALSMVGTLVMETFAVDTYQINLLPVSYEAAYLPFAILSIWCTERYGMRACLTISSFALIVCAWLRYAGGVIGADSTPGDARSQQGWALIMAGSWIAAAGQPFVLQVATRVSLDWFPSHEVALATTIGTMMNVVGQLLGSLIPPYVVITAADLPNYMLGQAIFATFLFVATAVLTRDRPAHPPSKEAAEQWALREAASKTGIDPGKQALLNMWKDLKFMMSNRNYLLLCCSFPLSVGAIWALLTVEWTMVTPCGYDPVTAGAAGAVAIGVGVIVAFAVTPFMQKYRLYAPLQMGFTLFALAASLFVFGVNKPGNAPLIIVAWAFLGAAVEPLLPIGLELAVEQTFPVPPDSSAGVLLAITNVAALVMTLVSTELLQRDVSLECSNVVTPVAGYLVGMLLLSLIFVVFIKPEYKRSTVEGDAAAVGKALEDGSSISANTSATGTPLTISIENPMKAEAEVGSSSATAKEAGLEGAGVPRRRSSLGGASDPFPASTASTDL